MGFLHHFIDDVIARHLGAAIRTEPGQQDA
jgi:hypothetical protein